MKKTINPSFNRTLSVYRVSLIYLITLPINIPSLLSYLVWDRGLTGIGFILVAILLYILILFLVMHLLKNLYGCTEFSIDDKSVVSNVDYLWRKKKEVHFVNIKEIEIKVGVFQKQFGVGTVVVHTHGYGQHCIRLYDIENIDEVYNSLKQQMEKSKYT